MQRLASDDALRNDPHCAVVGIDDVLVSRLREAVPAPTAESMAAANC